MMPEKIDWTRVMPRTWRCQFRFIIDAPPTYPNKSNYYHHYMSRWSKFIAQVIASRLSKTEIRDVLPDIRHILPPGTTLSEIYPLLFSHRPALARSLFDCSAVFDNAPHELKSHIITVFGLKPSELENYLSDSSGDDASAA
jgi:hypothetical protein